MTRRILLNPQGLRISRPGIDVVTATPEQLLFSSDINYPKLVEKGVFIRDRNSDVPVVWLSKTYPIAPLIFFTGITNGGSFLPASAYVFGDGGGGYNRFQCRSNITGILFNTPYYWWAYV